MFDTKEYKVTAQYRSKKRIIKTFKQLSRVLDCIRLDCDSLDDKETGIGIQCKEKLREKTVQMREIASSCLEDVFWTVRLEELIDNISTRNIHPDDINKLEQEYKDD